MTLNAMRVFTFFFAIALSVAVVRPAEAQSMQWSTDGWCYQYTAAGWVRTSYYKLPIANNGLIYDVYFNGQWLKRVDVSYSGWTGELPAANMQASSPFSWWMMPSNPKQANATNVLFLEKATNRWWSLAQLMVAVQSAGGAGYMGGNPAGIIGGWVSTPNPNPLTTDSFAAERALSLMSPQLRQQFLTLMGPSSGYYLVR